MRLEFEMSKLEAEQILGKAIREALAGAAAEGLEVSSVDWDRYGQRVTVTMAPAGAVEAAEAGVA